MMNKRKGDGIVFYGANNSARVSDTGSAGYSCDASLDDSGGVSAGDSACDNAGAPDTGYSEPCCSVPCSTDPCAQSRIDGRTDSLTGSLIDSLSDDTSGDVSADTRGDMSGGIGGGAGVKSHAKTAHKPAREGDDQDFPATLPPLRGLVLAGGLSSRLGHDKANLKIHSDFGITDLLDRSMRVLRLVVDNIAVVGRKATGYPSIPDLVIHKGPVGGIASALAAFPGDAVLVLSCDLPFMNASILRKLLQARAEAPANTLMTAYRQAETGHKEALVAIYEPGATVHFLESLYADKLKVSMVVPEEQQFFIEYGAEDSLPFFNINYPADLEVVKRLIEVVHTED